MAAAILAAMGRFGILLALVLAVSAAGCGGGGGSAPAGDASAGKRLFLSDRLKCYACHTFAAAGSHGSDDEPPNGPHLDKLPEFAKHANRGSLVEFVRESIRSPTAYTQPGFPRGLMHTPRASDAEIDDLVAFLVANVG